MEPTLSDVLAAVEKLHVKFDNQAIELVNAKRDIEALDERVSCVEDCIDKCQGDVSVLCSEHSNMKKNIYTLRDIVTKQQRAIQSMHDLTLDIQARSMRNNLLFHNLPETKNEDCETTVCTELRKAGFKEDIQIERIHRLGQVNPRGKNPRPIVAKLPDKLCEKILEFARRHLRDQSLRVTRQFPQEIKEKRQKMWEIAETFKQKDSSCKTKISGDGRLFVNGQRYANKYTTPKPDEILKLNASDYEELSKFPLTEGKVILEGGSSFLAAVAKVTTLQDARQAYQAFLLQPGRLAACHNIGIYRVTNPTTSKTEEDWADDGAHGAGRVLKNLLHRKNLTNVALFLSRGSDGLHLGTRRFRLLEEAAESALERL